MTYFNPLPPRGGRLRKKVKQYRAEVISIHSLRVEGDHDNLVTLPNYDISIHSLRVEGDFNHAVQNCCYLIFQSTPSAWRETFCRPILAATNFYFNPLPPRGGRRIPFLINDRAISISIHSLRVEGDTLTASRPRKGENFNPLPPRGGRRRGSWNLSER